MKILQVFSSIDPAGGGLAACYKALTPALTNLGCQCECVCVDDPQARFLPTMPGPIHPQGPPNGGYRYSSHLLPWLRAHAKNYDTVIVHGLWQYHGVAVHRALSRTRGTRYFVFSHGMLDPWFQRQYPVKHLKKLVYWWLIERRVLRDAAAVLFTCEEERNLAQHAFPGFKHRERIVTLGTTAPEGDPEIQREAFFLLLPNLRGTPFWLFFGRIHVKKGIDLLIDAYAQLSRSVGHPLPDLVIAGPCADSGYLQALKTRAAESCPTGKVQWPGMISGPAKWGILRAAEIFILPSHQENFGMAVAEALACGTPVLLSDKVNIWREIKGDGAGLVESDTAVGTISLLERWMQLAPQGRAAMAAAATKCYTTRYEIQASAQSLVAVLGEPSLS